MEELPPPCSGEYPQEGGNLRKLVTGRFLLSAKSSLRALALLTLLAWLLTAWCLWRTRQWTPRAVMLRDIGKAAKVISFVGNGATLATWSPAIKRLILWDVLTGRVRGEVEQANDKYDLSSYSHDLFLLWLACSRDGTKVIALGEDFDFKVRDVVAGRTLAGIPLGYGGAGADFSPDSKTLATAAPGGAVYLWDLDTGRLLAWLEGDPATRCIRFSPDGKRLAILRASLTGTGTGMSAIEMAHAAQAANQHTDDQCCGPGRFLARWPTAGRRLYRRYRAVMGHTAGEEIVAHAIAPFISNLSFSPDGRLLAVSYTKPAPPSWRYAARVSQRLANSLFPPVQGVVVLDVATGEHYFELPGSTRGTFLPDGKTLGTYDETDDSVMIWDVPPPRKLPPWLALTTLGGGRGRQHNLDIWPTEVADRPPRPTACPPF